MRNIRFLSLFLAFSYLISWIIWLPLYLPYFVNINLPVFPYHHALGAIGPISAAFIVKSMEGGKAAMGDLFSRMTRWKVSFIWYFIAIICPLVILFAAILTHNVSGKVHLDFSDILHSKEFPEFSFIIFFLYNLVTFGLGEETGWRGYALPKLQTKLHPFVATIVLTIFWAGWHIPIFFYRPGYVEMGLYGIIGWFLSLFTGAILLTLIYNSTRQSILLVSLFHATINVVFTSQASTPELSQFVGILITVLGVAVLVATKFRLGLEEDQVESKENEYKSKIFIS